MAYCGPRGLPHSHFLGGPAAWTQADRDKALAWQELERQTCGGCGTRPEEWDPEQGGSRHAYEYVDSVCPGCEKKEARQAKQRSSEYEGFRGLQILRRRPKPSTPSTTDTRRPRG